VCAGVLLRRMQTDSRLTGVSHIVIDEVHEVYLCKVFFLSDSFIQRSVDSDFSMAVIREVCSFAIAPGRSLCRFLRTDRTSSSC
jgi:HrpA-like RNA helicase